MKNYRYKERRDRMIRRIGIWVGEIAGMILLAYIVITFVAQGVRVNGESMQPAYNDRALVLVNKIDYRMNNPRRKDAALIRLDNEDSSTYTIKRVIGLPGENILIKDGQLFINGEEQEDLFEEEILSAGLAAYTIQLGEDEYFVMGDNCNNSEDSRAANVGNISRDQFVGKVTLVLSDGKDR